VIRIGLREATMITLHTDAFLISPYVFSCFVALTEKGLPFEVSRVSLGDKAQLRPDYKAATITARVPALTHDDFCVAESTAIVEYLDEVFPAPKYAPLLPEDARERARARQVMSWLRSDDTLGLRDERPTTTMFYERSKVPLTPRGKASADKLVEVAGRLLSRANARTLFETWCIADADLAFMLHRLVDNGHDLPPPVRSFADEQWKRPSIRRFLDQERAPFVPY
jgi:glutathione S-transferase